MLVLPGMRDGQISAIVSPCGLFLAASKRAVNLLTLLPGRQMAFLPPQKPRWWVVDDVLLESILVSETEMGLEPGRFRDLELLQRYREFENNHTQERNGWPKLEVQEVASQAGKGKRSTYSIWTYSVPAPLTVFGQAVSRVSYLTVAIEDAVFVLSVPLRPNDDPDKVHKLLHSGAEALERRPSADDLAKMVGLIRQASLDTKSCSQFIDVMSTNLRRVSGKLVR